MQKRLLILSTATLLLVFANSQLARAQTDSKTFELGVQFSEIRSDRFDPRLLPGRKIWDPGFGGRFAVNVTDYIGVEGEVNFFSNADDFQRLGRKTQGLFGIKAGQRRDKFGVFGKFRPGFMRFGEVFDCPGADSLSCGRFAKTYFSLDFGGVAEFYPSPRTVVRFDVGDTVIRFGRITVQDAASEVPLATRPVSGTTRHNLQMSVGVGFRF